MHFVHKGRVYVAGTNAIDADAEGTPILGQALCERDDRGLGAAVREAVARPGQSHYRGHVHDHPAFLPRQMGPCCLAHQVYAGQVHRDDLLPLRRLHRFNGAATAYAGVIDEDVDALQFGDRGARGAFDVRSYAYVSAESESPAALSVKVPHGRLELRAVDVDASDVRAFGDEAG